MAVLTALAAGNVSPIGYVPREDEAAFLAENLQRAIVASKCACGEAGCNTYYFDVPDKSRAVSLFTVRFHARGEMMLHIDSEGDIYKVERLYDDVGPLTVYSRKPDGSWSPTYIVRGATMTKSDDAI